MSYIYTMIPMAILGIISAGVGLGTRVPFYRRLWFWIAVGFAALVLLFLGAGIYALQVDPDGNGVV